MLSEISQTEKDKYCMISLICGIWKQKQKHKQTNKKLIDTENRLAIARGWRVSNFSLQLEYLWEDSVTVTV